MPDIPVEPVIAIVAALVAGLGYYYRHLKNKPRDEWVEGRSGIQNLLVRRLPLPLPETEQITKSEIIDALEKEGIDTGQGRSTTSDVRVVFTDGNYLAPKPMGNNVNRATDVMAITQWLPYQPEIFDCEDYGGLFWSLTQLVNGVNSVGYVMDWSAGHSYNVLVDSWGNVRFLEPQSDKAVEIKDESSYQLEQGMIIF